MSPFIHSPFICSLNKRLRAPTLNRAQGPQREAKYPSQSKTLFREETGMHNCLMESGWCWESETPGLLDSFSVYSQRPEHDPCMTCIRTTLGACALCAPLGPIPRKSRGGARVLASKISPVGSNTGKLEKRYPRLKLHRLSDFAHCLICSASV